MNNQPRASNQVSLYQENKWVCGAVTSSSLDKVFMVTQAVFTVDKAIQRAKEQKQ